MYGTQGLYFSNFYLNFPKNEVARANYQRKLDDANRSCAPLRYVKVYTLHHIFALIKIERCTVERKLKVGVNMSAM